MGGNESVSVWGHNIGGGVRGGGRGVMNPKSTQISDYK